MVSDIAILALSFIASFFTTFFLTPVVSKELVRVGIVGKDMQKKKKLFLAEMGGLSIVAGIVLGISVAIALAKNTYPLEILFGALASILVVSIVGIVDDLFQLPQLAKAFLPVLGALPLMALREGARTVALPFFGAVDFGLFYPIILIPLGITGAANATNILAGLNGLEAGLGVLMHGTVFLVSLLVFSSQPESLYSALISGIVLFSLLAFLKFNIFPARIFPGDIGTLVIGGSLAVSVIIGNIERVGVILIFPYFIELFLKARTRFKGTSFGILQKDGTLSAPKGFPQSLTHVVMKAGKFTELQVVLIILLIEAFFGALAILSVI